MLTTSTIMLTTTVNKKCELQLSCWEAKASKQQTLQAATGQQQQPAMSAPSNSNGASNRASKQKRANLSYQDANYYYQDVDTYYNKDDYQDEANYYNKDDYQDEANNCKAC